MNDFTIINYDTSHFDEWNSFIGEAKNATFLFHRNFMDYHQDRFEDYSLMIYLDRKLVAVFPAHRTKDRVFSHLGLTYGGLCLGKEMDVVKHKTCLEAVLNFLRREAVYRLTVKLMPEFYSFESVNQFSYLAFQCGGVLQSREMNLCVDYDRYAISKSKLKRDRRVREQQLEIRESDDLVVFWNGVLIPLLKERYQIKPVHSIDEIKKLQQLFPDRIKQFSVYLDSAIVAGITIFEFEEGVKSQYGAATPLGKELRALDHLFIYLIKKYEELGMRFFDMGIVADSSDLGFNAGLLQQKRELGCTTYLQDIIEFKL